MNDRFSSMGIKAGVWEGTLRCDTAPKRVALTLHGRTIGQASLTGDGDGIWRVNAPLPAEALADGSQTFMLIADDGEGLEGPRPGAERLANLPIIAGGVLDGDLRAEIDLLRAEIDLLKREFRRLATNE